MCLDETSCVHPHIVGEVSAAAKDPMRSVAMSCDASGVGLHDNRITADITEGDAICCVALRGDGSGSQQVYVLLRARRCQHIYSIGFCSNRTDAAALREDNRTISDWKSDEHAVRIAAGRCNCARIRQVERGG